MLFPDTLDKDQLDLLEDLSLDAGVRTIVSCFTLYHCSLFGVRHFYNTLHRTVDTPLRLSSLIQAISMYQND